MIFETKENITNETSKQKRKRKISIISNGLKKRIFLKHSFSSSFSFSFSFSSSRSPFFLLMHYHHRHHYHPHRAAASRFRRHRRPRRHFSRRPRPFFSRSLAATARRHSRHDHSSVRSPSGLMSRVRRLFTASRPRRRGG